MFDNRLKELRIKKGLNMKQTALQLGMPYTTYVGYEKDLREPDSEILNALADFFNCTIDYLLGRSDIPLAEYNEMHPKAVQTANLTERQQKIVTLFDNLTEPQQDNLIGRAELMSEQNEEQYRQEENA